MTDSPENAKVIPITRGGRRSARSRQPAISPPRDKSTLGMLAGLHPRVRAVLVAQRGKWEYFERIRESDDTRSVLQDVSLRELLKMLDRAASPGQIGQRITVSPWPGFDLAVLLRDGRPLYAACFDPDTSVYIAESTLPEVARFFDRQKY